MPDNNIPEFPSAAGGAMSREQVQGRDRMLKALFDTLRTQFIERGTHVAKLKELVALRDASITTLTTERDSLKNSLSEASASVVELYEHAAELQEELAALMAPPHDYAVVAGLNPEDSTADVFLDGRRYRVGIHPAVSPEKLACGTSVVVNGKTRTIQLVVDDSERGGMQAQLTELMGNGRTALVEDYHGEKRVVLVGQQVPTETLEPRTPVLLRESVIVRSLRTANQSLGSGSRFLLAEMPNTTFDDIGGMDKVLARLVSGLENPYKVPEGYDQLKHKKTFSVILMGLPGNGKTMIARAIARREFDRHREAILKHAKGNFFLIGGTQLYDKWLGNTEGDLEQIFRDAETLYKLTGAVSTIFFDDCDAFFLTRSAGLSTNINASVNTRFSTIVDGVKEMVGINLIAATNRLDLMDLAVLRRFDRQVRISPPDTPKKASEVLHKQLRGIPIVGGTTAEAVNRLVTAMFAKTPDNELLEIIYRKDGGEENSEIITLSQMISGKFLRDIVENAKDLAIERGVALPPDRRVWALTPDDLMQSLQSELLNKESLPSSETTVADWLQQKGDKRIVEYVTTLRDRRKSDAKRDRLIDDKVV